MISLGPLDGPNQLGFIQLSSLYLAFIRDSSNVLHLHK